MNAKNRRLIKWTLVSAALGGVLFLGLSVSRARAVDASPLDHLGPVAAMTVIGFTVGGLVGPLLLGLATRNRRR